MAKKNKKETFTCTSCGRKIQLKSNFYNHNGYKYKHLGYMPFCKKCLSEIYEKYYKSNYESEKIALYKFCERELDKPFYSSVYEGAISRSKKTGWSLYSSYMTQINSLKGANDYGDNFLDGEIFDDISLEYSEEEIEGKEKNNKPVSKKTTIFWGNGFERKDYEFLDVELDNWKKTHKCDNQSELTLLKEICMKILEIRKAREQGNPTSKLQKDLQELMKTASVDPAKANAISDSQTVDRFGVWIKDIEQHRPAEWHDKQDKYVDMDGFKPYIKNYIVRPIKNFFTGTKDFLINGEDLSFKKDEKDG